MRTRASNECSLGPDGTTILRVLARPCSEHRPESTTDRWANAGFVSLAFEHVRSKIEPAIAALAQRPHHFLGRFQNAVLDFVLPGGQEHVCGKGVVLRCETFFVGDQLAVVSRENGASHDVPIE